MKPNVASLDRLLRATIGGALLMTAVAFGAGTVAGIVLLALAAILVATAALSFCPLYKLLHIARYRFGAENGETNVRLDAQVELDGIAAVMPQVARIAVKHGVDANLATLKLILEQRHAPGVGSE